MLKKNLILLSISTILCGCLFDSSAKKINVEGERISIVTESEDVKPDLLLKSQKVALPKQVNYSDWPQYSAFPDNAPLHLKLNKVVKKAWSQSIGSSLSSMQSFATPPIAFNDTLYSLNIDNEIVSINAKTGKVNWTLRLKSELDTSQITLVGSLAIDGKTLIATLGSGEIYAVNILTQDIVWSKKLNETIHSAPVFKDGILVIKTVNNKLFAYNLKTGENIWKHEGVHETFNVQGNSSPAIANNNIIYVSYSNNEVYALDAATGKEFWSKSLSPMYNFEFSSNKSRVVSSPIVLGTRVYVVDNHGDISSFDTATGIKVWTAPVNSIVKPWVSGNSLFTITKNNQLICVFLNSGKVKWVSDLNKTMLHNVKNKENTSFTAPILAGNRIFVASNKGILGTFNPANGNIFRINEIKQNVSVSPIIVNKMVYFLTNSSNIIAYK